MNHLAPISRREFLAGASAVSALVISASGAAPAVKPVIDTHTHFYDPTRPQGVPWPPANNKLLHRRVLPDDYKPLARPLGITGTVVVEASAWLEDNQWILDLADREPFIVGFVGNVPPGTVDFAAQLARFAKHRLFRGIRVNAAALKAGLEQPRFTDDLRRLADADRSLDVNGVQDLLPGVARLAKELPNLRIIINHVANVRMSGGRVPDSWRDGMQAAAQQSNVFCKVSGLVEQSGAPEGKAPTDAATYAPVLDAVWKFFGADRLIYGSNWPVCERGATLAGVHQIATEFIQPKGRDAVGKFFAGNAARAYRWVQR
jgi:predicted TIM-barrel fold metal-dependent hydrolase